MSTLQHIVDDYEADFLAVTEHWKTYEQLKHYRLLGYNLVSSYCRNYGEHGGSALFFKDNYPFRTRDDLNNYSIPFIIECCAAQVRLNMRNVIMISVYRPESSAANYDIFLERLSRILSCCLKEKADVILAGDFNINFLLNTSATKNFRSMIESFGHRLTIHEPTRISKTSATCIDNIITNVVGTGSVIEEHISDHSAQKFIFPKTEQSNKVFEKRQVRNINKGNMKKFIDRISDQLWTGVCEDLNDDANSLWKAFFEKFNEVFTSCFPLKTIGFQKNKKRKSKSTTIQEYKKLLDCLFLLSRRSDEYLSAYKETKRKYDIMIRKERTEHNRKIIEKSTNRSKTVWNLVNETLGKQRKNTSEIKNESEPCKLLNKFNNFFVNVRSSLNIEKQSDYDSDCIQRQEKSFFVFDITEDEVIATVRRMKNTKSAGWDGVPMEVIKACIHLIATPLAIIMNKSFKDGVFPEDLKIAVIKPIFKNGDPKDPGSYRPISILSTFSKIFEKVLANRLLKFFNKFKVFSQSQHGYIHGKSTETAIFELYNSIVTALERKELPVGLFLDLSKAFDCVDTEILLEKLEKYGIRDKQLKLIESYLKNRPQTIKMVINGSEYQSSQEVNKAGVPQGSILGPLLFLIYINDLPSALRDHIFGSFLECLLFADDANVILRSPSFGFTLEMVQTILDDVNKWCTKNRLVLNVAKSECMVFSTDRSTVSVPQVVKDCVTVSTSAKFLGVHLDNHLKWNFHIDNLVKRLNSVIYSVCVLKTRMDFQTLKMVYFANFQSLISYSIIFWGGSSLSELVFLRQKSMLRTLLGLNYRESCRGHFKQNNLLTVYGLFIYKVLIFMYLHPHYFEVHRNVNLTRRKETFFYPHHSLAITEKSPLYLGMKLYNCLPSKFRMMRNVKIFKKTLHELVIECEPYSLSEYFTFCNY